jgi:hypothetical protein
MKSVVWMAAVCGASWLTLAAFGTAADGPELLLGMAGPLVAASATWAMVERTYRANPARVPRLMLAAFFTKMVFFGAYVIIALRVLRLQPTPFIVSFTCYFVALHLAEALLLRRLFATSVPPVRS